MRPTAGRVTAIVVANKAGLSAYRAKVYVDATGDGDLSAWAGAPFEKGGDEGQLQSVSLCFLMAGVDDDAYAKTRLHPHCPESPMHRIAASDEPPHDAAWSERALNTDMAVHRAISKACGNVRLAEEISRYDMLVNAMAEAVGNRRDIQTRGLREHVSILDKLLAEDAEGAADEIARHINNTARDLEAIMFPDD